MAWRRFKKNRIAFLAMLFILIVIIISILGYLITPDSTPFSNDQHLELSAKNPGFKVKMLKVKKNEAKSESNFLKKMLFGERNSYTSIPVFRDSISGDKMFVELYTGLTPNEGEIKGYFLVDIAYPIDNEQYIGFKGKNIEFYDFEGNFIKISLNELQKKVKESAIEQKIFLLGTDRFGRDMLSQLLIGTRVSLSIGFISVAISLLIGIFLGAVSGFFRGWVDNLVMWFINVVWSIPTILLVIAITFALGKGFWQVFIAVGLTMWVEVARVIRGQIMSIREKEFVEAGIALGFNNLRIIFHHILPNVMGPVIVISAANFATSILIEAGLSFLGLGVQPPVPSWGSMIRDHYAYIILDSAFLAILPGLAIMLMVLAFMLIGNGLRDALDVKV